MTTPMSHLTVREYFERRIAAVESLAAEVAHDAAELERLLDERDEHLAEAFAIADLRRTHGLQVVS